MVYNLIDATQYKGRSVLVVGGGDSALEAAVAISQVPNTVVTLSYRGSAFSRVKSKNRQHMQSASDAGRLTVLLNSKVVRIDPSHVLIERDGEPLQLPNDAVIVCAGGLPPTPLLKAIGVRFEMKHGTE